MYSWQQNWIFLMSTTSRCISAEKQEAFNETSGRLPALFAATKLDIFHQTSGHFQDMFAATEPDIFKQTSRHFPAVFLRTKLDMFVEMSGHIPGTKGEVNFHMNVVKLKVKYEMLQSRSMR